MTTLKYKSNNSLAIKKINKNRKANKLIESGRAKAKELVLRLKL